MDRKVAATTQPDRQSRSVRYVGVAGLPDGTKRIALGSGVITGLLSRGGSAYVYEIWNSQLEVSRAIKLLHPDRLEETKERFETEVKITAKLHHPNIVEIYVVGNWNGLPYIEMERVDGITLEQLIAKRGAIPVEVCTAVAIMVARALEYAHNQRYMIYGREYRGIIHRDLKPGNVMLSRDGQVKLMDFGIAKPVTAASDTSDGIVVGTMQYLAPEQLQGGTVDVRADIYSFGTVLYELLTGTRTFPEKNLAHLVTDKLSNRFQPLNKFRVAIPHRLRRLIHRCLNYQKHKRVQSAGELLQELEGIHRSVSNQSPEQALRGYVRFAADTKTVLDTRWFAPHLTSVIQVTALLLFIAGVGFLGYQIRRASLDSDGAGLWGSSGGNQTQQTVRNRADDNVADQLIWEMIEESLGMSDEQKSPTPSPRQRSRQHTGAGSGYHASRRGIPPIDSVLRALGPAPASSSVTESSQDGNLLERLSKRHGTSNVLKLIRAELRARRYENALALYDYADASTVHSLKGKLYRMRALQGAGNEQKLNEFLLSQDIPDAELYLAKAFYLCSSGQPEKARLFYRKATKTPAKLLSPVALEQRRMLCRARVATAIYNTSPSEETKKEAMDSWYEIKLRLYATPEHRLYQQADAEIRRIGG